MTQTVCIIDPIHPAGTERIGERFTIVAAADGGAADCDFVVVRTSPVDAALIARLPGLRAIVKHGAGVDNIDIAAATARGVMVANTPGGNNSTAVAEGAVALMLGLLRRLGEMDAVVREGRWNTRWGVRLGDLTGARVGLIGFGRIARCVATICGAGFGCAVSAHDPLVADADMAAAGVRPASLTGVLACDVVSIHVPLTDGTRGLIGSAELALMPRHGIIVNCSRGGIVDEDALAAALRGGTIAGAGVDVFADEPPAAGNPLLGLPNALLSPHVAGVTENGMRDMALNVAQVLETLAGGGIPETLLNPAAMGR